MVALTSLVICWLITVVCAFWSTTRISNCFNNADKLSFVSAPALPPPISPRASVIFVNWSKSTASLLKKPPFLVTSCNPVNALSIPARFSNPLLNPSSATISVNALSSGFNTYNAPAALVTGVATSPNALS